MRVRPGGYADLVAGDAPARALRFRRRVHLLAQHRQVYAFTRPDDRTSREVALRLSAPRGGDSDERPPEPLL